MLVEDLEYPEFTYTAYRILTKYKHLEKQFERFLKFKPYI